MNTRAASPIPLTSGLPLVCSSCSRYRSDSGVRQLLILSKTAKGPRGSLLLDFRVMVIKLSVFVGIWKESSVKTGAALNPVAAPGWQEERKPGEWSWEINPFLKTQESKVQLR